MITCVAAQNHTSKLARARDMTACSNDCVVLHKIPSLHCILRVAPQALYNVTDAYKKTITKHTQHAHVVTSLTVLAHPLPRPHNTANSVTLWNASTWVIMLASTGCQIPRISAHTPPRPRRKLNRRILSQITLLPTEMFTSATYHTSQRPRSPTNTPKHTRSSQIK